MNEIEVRFEPENKTIRVPSGSTVLEAAQKSGIPLFHPCGGKGICGRCRIRIPDAVIPQTDQEQEFFADMSKKEEWHLSCVTRLTEDCTVCVPPESTVITSGDKRSLGLDETFDDPVYSKRFASVTPPGLDCGPLRSHAEAIAEAFNSDAEDVQYSALSDLPKLFPFYQSKWEVTAVMEENRIFRLESKDTRSRFFGLAFDIGTTSLVVSLVDLNTDKVLGEMCASNPQAVWGADVISRIGHIQSAPHGLEQLRATVLQTLSGMTEKICDQYSVRTDEVYAASFVGNTIMEHTLLGISPESIASMPFHPAFRHEWVGEARQIGLPINPQARAYVCPVVSGYVGGDTLAVILATGLDLSDELTLAIDLGTNGELVLGRKGEIYACAAAAGPAFEGGRIRCGMRAVPGAISSVRIDDDIRISVIGDKEPIGLCGSGLIDSVAELVRIGVIAKSGSIQKPPDSAGVPRCLMDRVLGEEQHRLEFLLTHDGQRSVRICQRDVREFQLAKGAVRAGCEEMIRVMGCRPDDIKRILISGVFGTNLRVESVREIGLLPAFEPERLRFIGNGAMQGSRTLLLSSSARSRVERLKDEIHYLELSANPEFQEQFADSMQF